MKLLITVKTIISFLVYGIQIIMFQATKSIFNHEAHAESIFGIK